MSADPAAYPAAPTTGAPDTRTRILQVALEMFAEKGFADTSTRELSERLGFTKAALYYHFATKDDLFSALAAPVVEALTGLVSQATLDPSPQARRAVLASYIAIVTANLDVIRVLAEDPSVARRRASVAYRPLYERLARLLSGEDTPDTAQKIRVRAALGAVRAALLYTAPTKDPAVVREATLAAACGALGIPGSGPG